MFNFNLVFKAVKKATKIFHSTAGITTPGSRTTLDKAAANNSISTTNAN